MRNTVALLVLLLAATAMVCRSSEEEGDAEDDAGENPSWTEWAMDKLTGVFKYDQVKESAQSVANDAGDATSDYLSEKAVEAEDAAAEAAKELSNKESGHS